jgi:hypothetical protein
MSRLAGWRWSGAPAQTRQIPPSLCHVFVRCHRQNNPSHTLHFPPSTGRNGVWHARQVNRRLTLAILPQSEPRLLRRHGMSYIADRTTDVLSSASKEMVCLDASFKRLPGFLGWPRRAPCRLQNGSGGFWWGS